MSIKAFYNKLINSGTGINLDNALNKRIKILNTYALVWINLIVILTFIENLIYYAFLLFSDNFNDGLDDLGDDIGSYSRIVQLSTVILLSIVIILNKNKKFAFAKALYLITTLGNFTLFTLFITPGIYSEYFFIIVPPLALSLYSKNIIPVIVLVISFLLFVTPYNFYPVYPDSIVKRFFPIPQIYIFISIYLLVNYFKKLNSKNEKLLQIEKDKVLKDKVLLENQQRELEELNEFKSHFFVNLSHEIRTPLTLIQGHASQINLNKSKDKNQEKVNIIKTQSEQIQFIINNIMDLSKIDAKEFQLDSQYIDVSSFLNKHYINYKDLFDAKGISFSLKNDTKDLAFKVDEYIFSKSINNLLNNALKFTSNGGSVSLNACLEKQSLKIELTDNGIGIHEKDLEYIFNRFFQSKNHITKSQGSGIGLSFTKSIIEAHNFSINVKSTPNIATTFSIEIPSEALQKSELNTIELSNEKRHISPSFSLAQTNSKRKILIVEDHTQMRDYIAGLLNKYNIMKANNGNEALDLLKTNTFDVIITDYMMPIMDGEVLVSNIKKQGIKTPIIVLTARTDAKGKLNMLRLGIDGYLNKPFIKEELLMHLKLAFQSYDVINQFDKQLKEKEKQNLNKFAQKFNEELKDFIFSNMHASNFGIDAIAEHFNISKSTLNRKVKTLLGQVPKDIIMEARLQKARVLLEENPKETQKNVAKAVGISNTSYFFKKMEERFYKK
ncbi:response regulator [Flavivirga spongiicola]|uniref:histidine kinase n=1 Tax=Flavivirga spongiicola TaxID=421621 RepID=A0ABU7XVV5_9FLAO|nr:response regulator [Flavivirga sp. MEBiC05379]MDO5979899.1 response regulator [Flavivirga sp. MEBiC05379]